MALFTCISSRKLCLTLRSSLNFSHLPTTVLGDERTRGLYDIVPVLKELIL